MISRAKKSVLLELGAYGALIAIFAVVVRAAISPGQTANIKEAVVKRSDADATLLRSRLGLTSGTQTIVEFMDFECPPCRMSWPSLRAYLKAHPDVQYRPVNFPLAQHANAFPAAVTVEIARSNGYFDKAFDDLFSGPSALEQSELNSYLHRHGSPQLVGTKEAVPFEHRVREAMKLGKDLKINSTPTILAVSRTGHLSEIRSLDGLDSALH